MAPIQWIKFLDFSKSRAISIHFSSISISDKTIECTAFQITEHVSCTILYTVVFPIRYWNVIDVMELHAKYLKYWRNIYKVISEITMFAIILLILYKVNLPQHYCQAFCECYSSFSLIKSCFCKWGSTINNKASNYIADILK